MKCATCGTLLALSATALARVAKDGVTGRLPALGWNSWNAFYCDISEEKFLSAAQKMIDLGLKDAGYNYVNIDDCWQNKDSRSDDGHLVVNTTRFPNSINGLADTVHEMGFKLGIYNSAGDATCAGYPASLEHEEVDAADFAAWGVDYLKYDNCGVPDDWKDQYVSCNPDYVETGANGTCSTEQTPNLAPEGYDWSTSKSAERYRRMRDALEAQDRVILYSLCDWGQADVFSWGNDTAQSWRMSDDISANWESVMNIVNLNSFKMNSVDFWSHNDADMLHVGNGNITADEAKSHFALWAAMKSPLLIGTDLDAISDETVAVLKNKYLLAFNQDTVFGRPATPYKWGINPDWTYNSTHPAEYWAGASQVGTLVLMMNTEDNTASRSAVWSEIPGLDKAAYQVTDIWSGEDVGCVETQHTVDVPSHGIAGILVSSSPCSE